VSKRVIAWGCEFGCGRRVTVNRKTVDRHEKTCFWNPARRACVTCDHEIPGYVDEPDYTTGYHYEQDRECKTTGLDEEALTQTTDKSDPKKGSTIRWNCPLWTAKPVRP
jgi:hypothetical protein